VRLTQGAFSFLPDLTDDQILAQIKYIVKNGWAVSIEWTEDPHPRNNYWELWGLPLFGIKDPSVVMYELDQCRLRILQHTLKLTRSTLHVLLKVVLYLSSFNVLTKNQAST